MKIRGLGAKYDRPDEEMWKDGIIMSDLHEIIKEQNLLDYTDEEIDLNTSKIS